MQASWNTQKKWLAYYATQKTVIKKPILLLDSVIVKMFFLPGGAERGHPVPQLHWSLS